jgi:hypothetical protein
MVVRLTGPVSEDEVPLRGEAERCAVGGTWPFYLIVVKTLLSEVQQRFLLRRWAVGAEVQLVRRSAFWFRVVGEARPIPP